MKGKRRLLRILLFPVFIPIFIIGWCMNCVGDNKIAMHKQKQQTCKIRDDFVSLMPAVFEEEQEIAQ